jgi:hypothetical protein
MKMAEIRERYAGEWVLIKFSSMVDLDDNLGVIDGEVVAHARTWKEINRCREQLGPGNYTVEFLGETPEFEGIDEDSEFVL